MLDLKETAEMMSSPDYKERFRAEYAQLAMRYNKLKHMLSLWDTVGVEFLGFTPTCPRSTYNLQIEAMEDYIAVLEARAVMEDINLEDLK